MANNKQLTLLDVQKAFPNRKNSVTEEAVELINRAQTEPEFQGETLLQTAVTYEAVLTRNKAGIVDYLNAIRFCAYLISLEDNFTEAYKKTFFDRDFVKNRMEVPTDSVQYKELTSAASRYRRSKIVTDILTLSNVPLDLMFMGARYKALGVLAREMEEAAYSKDRINAAKELLAATKSDVTKIELDVGVQENNAVASMMDQLAAMAAKQKMMLEAGATDLAELGSMKVQADYIDAEVQE